MDDLHASRKRNKAIESALRCPWFETYYYPSGDVVVIIDRFGNSVEEGVSASDCELTDIKNAVVRGVKRLSVRMILEKGARCYKKTQCQKLRNPVLDGC